MTGPGFCCRCEEYVPRRVLVAIVEVNSGPGGSVYACLPCARVLARSPFAPDWVAEEVAHAEAEQ